MHRDAPEPLRLLRAAGVLLLLATLFVAFGCESANTARPRYTRTHPNEVEIDKITFNPGLDKRAFIDSVYAGDANGLMRIQVNLSNHDTSAGTLGDAILRATIGAGEAGESKQRGFKYKFVWFDESGLEIYDPTSAGWKRKLLSTGELTTITGLAPSPNAVDWQLTMQPWTGY